MANMPSKLSWTLDLDAFLTFDGHVKFVVTRPGPHTGRLWQSLVYPDITMYVYYLLALSAQVCKHWWIMIVLVCERFTVKLAYDGWYM